MKRIIILFVVFLVMPSYAASVEATQEITPGLTENIISLLLTVLIVAVPFISKKKKIACLGFAAVIVVISGFFYTGSRDSGMPESPQFVANQTLTAPPPEAVLENNAPIQPSTQETPVSTQAPATSLPAQSYSSVEPTTTYVAPTQPQQTAPVVSPKANYTPQTVPSQTPTTTSLRYNDRLPNTHEATQPPISKPQPTVIPKTPSLQQDPAKTEGEIGRALRASGINGITAQVSDDFIVTLKGSASSDAEKERAFSIAQRFDGVKGSKDKVFVVTQ